MAETLTRVFKTLASRDQVGEERAAAPPAGSALVVGERALSRSLLLLAAVAAAAQMAVRVVFFTQTHIQKLPAFLQKRGPILNPESLKQIKFCYPRTLEELLRQVAALHESSSMSPTPPSLIIVDRLEAYLRGPGSSRQAGSLPEHSTHVAHLSALLCDTAIFLTQGPSSSAPCQLIASYLSEEEAGGQTCTADPVLDVLDRYFQSRCTLTKDESYEAKAAELQEIWHVYISGTKDNRKRVDQEWQLLISTDGSMEFKMI